MRLVEIRNILKNLIDTKIEEKPFGNYVHIDNFNKISENVNKVNSIHLFPANYFQFIELNIRYPNGKYPFSEVDKFKSDFNALKNLITPTYQALNNMIRVDNPYQFNITLSKDIKTMDDYKKFNELINEFCKTAQALSYEGKAICRLDFYGFEKGSDILQFIVNAISNFIEIDILFAYLNKVISVAKEFLALRESYYNNKLVKAKINNYNANTRKQNAEAESIEIDNETKKQFIHNEIENNKSLIKEKISEKETGNLINKVIDLLESKNIIKPSLNAPDYIKKENDKISIDDEKLQKIIEEKKQKSLIEDKSKINDNK